MICRELVQDCKTCFQRGRTAVDLSMLQSDCDSIYKWTIPQADPDDAAGFWSSRSTF